MEFKKITAIVRPGYLAPVEQALQAIRVDGITVTRVKGYGEHVNFFSSEGYCTHARIEIYAEEHRVREIVEAIMAAARTGNPGDGIVAVLPVDRVYKIRQGVAGSGA